MTLKHIQKHSSVTEIQNNVESRQESLNSQEASAPLIPLEPEIVVQQESLSESEEDDYQIPFFPRRSTRFTRGAPLSRYGNVVSHSVGPIYPDFEFCGREGAGTVRLGDLARINHNISFCSFLQITKCTTSF